MKKTLFFLGIIFSNYTLSAQFIDTRANGIVGIGLTNTNTYTSGKPYTTLHIEGNLKDRNANDGLLIPRLSLRELYNKNPEIYGDKQISTLIYIYNVGDHLPMHRRYAPIQREGFYYWGGEQWIPLKIDKEVNENITSDTSLSETYETHLKIIKQIDTTPSIGRDKSTKFLDSEPVFTTEKEKQEMEGVSYYNTKENILYIYIYGKGWVKTIEFEDPNESGQ